MTDTPDTPDKPDTPTPRKWCQRSLRVVEIATEVIEGLRAFFPLRGLPWVFAGNAGGSRSAYLQVERYALLLDACLNPDNRPPAIIERHRDGSLVCRPGTDTPLEYREPALDAAFEAMRVAWVRILRHYNWYTILHEELYGPPAWEWPDAPPIDPAELDLLGQAAGRLKTVAEWYCSPSRDAETPNNSGNKRMTAEEANAVALKLAAADRLFVQRSQREWATLIGCSVGQVAKLPLWIEVMQKTGRGRKGQKAPPKVVSLTGKLEAVLGEEDGELQQLIAEQRADAEPSPLDSDPPDKKRTVRTRKKM